METGGPVVTGLVQGGSGFSDCVEDAVFVLCELGRRASVS